MEVTPVQEGDAVVFVDATARHHHALVTAVHGKFYDTEVWTEEQVEEFYPKTRPDYYTEEQWSERKSAMVGTRHSMPSINVVYVSIDDTQRDPYGRQIQRSTSVVHRSLQSAHGMYWMNA